MKKELLKITTIFFVTVFAVVWALNFVFLGKAPKSKAGGETISYIFDPVSVNKSSGDFNVSVKIKPSVDMTIRGYQFKIAFDKSKTQFKNIQYKTGDVSVSLGDNDSKKEIINQNGEIKVVGEIKLAIGQVISPSQNTEMVAITFTANSAESSSITTGATDAIFSMIKADYSLFDVPSAGQASFSVNGGEGPTATPTVTPGGPTLTPTPTGGVNATVKLKLKFQGITGQTAEDLNRLKVKVRLYDENTEKYIDSDSSNFVSNGDGTWSSSEKPVSFDGVFPTHKHVLLVKGPYHVQKKICSKKPTETADGTYSCIKGNISLKEGYNDVFDLTGIVLLVGDLPDQNGAVDAYDISLVRNNLGKNTEEAVEKADVNRDGIVDTQDYSLIIAALSIKNDEE